MEDPFHSEPQLADALKAFSGGEEGPGSLAGRLETVARGPAVKNSVGRRLHLYVLGHLLMCACTNTYIHTYIYVCMGIHTLIHALIYRTHICMRVGGQMNNKICYKNK